MSDDLNYNIHFYSDKGMTESEKEIPFKMDIEPSKEGLKQIVTDGDNLWLEDAELNHEWAKGEQSTNDK